MRELWTIVSQLPGDSRFKSAVIAADEARQAAAKQDARVSELEAQLDRNRERGLIL